MSTDINRNDVKWLTLENETGTATLKQHGYIPYGDGNKALCCGGFAVEPDETPTPWIRLKSEFIRESCCKTCLNIFNKLKSV
jgi:hypothetical protein